MCVDDLVEDLSPERMRLACYRAARKCGMDAEFNGDILTIYEDDIKIDDLEDDYGFLDAFSFELKLMVVSDMVNELVDSGEIEADYIDEDGYVVYKPSY